VIALVLPSEKTLAQPIQEPCFACLATIARAAGDHCKILTDLGIESALNIYASNEGIMGSFGLKNETCAAAFGRGTLDSFGSVAQSLPCFLGDRPRKIVAIA
jgi:hypothetical protein